MNANRSFHGVAAGFLAATILLAAGACRREANNGPPADDGRANDSDANQMPPWMMMDGMRGRGGMMGRGGMGNMMRDMPVIRDLLIDHKQVQYHVENTTNGIRAEATSDNPQVATLLQQHVWQMKERMEKGQPIRMMDPLFRELFAHHRQIQMQVENTATGVRVTETSDDPQVVLLIRQHAEQFVPRVVKEGMQGAMRPTPLPPGYTETNDQPVPDGQR